MEANKGDVLWDEQAGVAFVVEAIGSKNGLVLGYAGYTVPLKEAEAWASGQALALSDGRPRLSPVPRMDDSIDHKTPLLHCSPVLPLDGASLVDWTAPSGSPVTGICNTVGVTQDEDGTYHLDNDDADAVRHNRLILVMLAKLFPPHKKQIWAALQPAQRDMIKFISKEIAL